MSIYESLYKASLTRILTLGVSRSLSRTGATIALFNEQFRIGFFEGFPMITSRKLYWKNVYQEFRWFMSGGTNIAFLHKYNVSIWDKWADENGEIGPAYGYQIARQWEKVKTGIIEDIEGRRHIISLWDVDRLDEMALPPCYHTLHFYVLYDRLNLKVSCRSIDMAVGFPNDVGVLSLLLDTMAEDVALPIGELIIDITDAHINVENVSAIKEYIQRPMFKLPKLVRMGRADYYLDRYESMEPIRMTLKE